MKPEGVRIGDIKKFITNQGDISGVVVGINRGLIMLVDTNGEKVNLDGFGIIIKDVKSVRLEPLLRERLTKISDIAKEKEDIKREEEKLELRKYVLNGDIEKESKALLNSLGLMDSNSFTKLLSDGLNKITNGKLYSSGYTVEVYRRNTGTMEVLIERSEDIEQFPDEITYTFLYREYDGTLFMGEENNKYKEILKEYKNNNKDLIISNKSSKNYKIEQKNNLTLRFNGKYLSYVHSIILELKYNRLDKAIIKEILKILSK